MKPCKPYSQSVSCSFLRVLPCFLQCKAFPSIANEALHTLSEALQTLQFSCSFLRILPCFLQGEAIPSIANEALQTLSVSCSFLCILPCFLRCKAFPSIASEALQTLSVVQFSAFYHAFCSASILHSRALAPKPTAEPHRGGKMQPRRRAST